MDAKIASYFYENGIAFNTAGSASFALMIEESMKFARQYPVQSYKVPNRHKFSGELLDKAYESTEKLVAPILAVGKKYGATIASDGWSDQHRRPILNWSELVCDADHWLVFFRTKPCGLMLQRCHQRHGTRCT